MHKKFDRDAQGGLSDARRIAQENNFRNARDERMQRPKCFAYRDSRNADRYQPRG